MDESLRLSELGTYSKPLYKIFEATKDVRNLKKFNTQQDKWRKLNIKFLNQRRDKRSFEFPTLMQRIYEFTKRKQDYAHIAKYNGKEPLVHEQLSHY